METAFQRDAAKVPQSDCCEQIFRQMRGLYRSECLSYWTDCLKPYTCTKYEFNLDFFLLHFPEFQATNIFILSWRLKKIKE